ncbi:TIGR01244 family sulfur transferase [Erythrobacter alti]|uniref:TIGR01244 family sulfur transferase n=1 Tax=Erythrobacter alti TaxID=1896145 RepID=UPI0030F48681
MDVRAVSPEFAVAPQIQQEDLSALADRGFVTVVCNRPDGEEPGQPPVDQIRAAAEAAGLAFHHIPVAGGAFPDASIAAFRKVRQEAEGPVLAYCRSGTRSITLDTLANPDNLSPSERLNRAKAAGYDLSPMRDTLT